MINKRTLVIGDIHGNYKGLKQALERSNFDYENDILISLGDLVDGHSQSYEVIEELLKIKNLIAIKGNHDEWFNHWIKTGIHPANWGQGAGATALSYINNTSLSKSGTKTSDIPQSHKDLFNNQLPYYIDENNNLFIHGGFDRNYKLEEQSEDEYWWNRELWNQALSFEATKRGNTAPNYTPVFTMVDDFKEIFIGHTSTQFWNSNVPMNAANIWNLDTGGGWHGYITIMCVDTKQFWQSDSAKELYPDFRGR